MLPTREHHERDVATRVEGSVENHAAPAPRRRLLDPASAVSALAPRTISTVGTATLVAGTLVFLLGIDRESLATFVVAAVVAGVGFGSAFLGVLRSMTQLAQPHERASLLSAVYVFSYLAFSVPAVVGGVLITHIGLRDSSLAYGTLVAVLAVFSLGIAVAASAAHPPGAATGLIDTQRPPGCHVPDPSARKCRRMAARTQTRMPARERVTAALNAPLASALGCFLLDPDDASSGVAFVPGELADNGTGGVHAAALAAVLELAADLLVLPTLDDDEHAVTHASSLQVLGGAVRGYRVEARAQLDRRSRRLAFVSAAATVDGMVVATAQLTESVVKRKQ
ncbi:hypothetical protein [uncultured Jatrophihabitans sp.]|uniref:hypothetical protein n=1 Tax=uncultured Jatrophihabitans sp. TaxID=1610747 RepID=UPI0035C96AB8